MRALLILAAVAVAFAQNQPVTTGVGQPVNFSHKQHAEAAHLKCVDCHKLASSGEVISIPTGKSCMTCHAQIAASSDSIKDLKSYVDENQSVPWIRVYELPSFVDFNHKTHSDTGTKCETCHGPVATREHLWRETDLGMGACMGCHRSTRASTNCGTCHNLDN